MAQSVSAVVAPEHGAITNMDKRISGQQNVALVPQRVAALTTARARIPDLQVDLDDVIASPKWVRSEKGLLTGPRDRADVVNAPPGRRPVVGAAQEANDPHEPAKRFLDQHAELFGHGAEALQGARITREFVGAHNGLRTVVWEQRLDDIPVFQSVLIAHITKNGELVNVSSLFVPAPEEAARLDPNERAALMSSPSVPARQAVVEAAKSIGETVKAQDVSELGPAPDGPKAMRKLAAPSLSGEVRAQLVWLPMNRSELRLCWKVNLSNSDRSESFIVVIDAQTGEDIVRQSVTFHLNETSYRVFTSDSPSPFSPGHATPNTTQPSIIQRNMQTWSALNATASPNGWINEGDYETVGNNVDAHLDWYSLNYDYRAGVGIRPTSFPTRVFDPSLTLPGDPVQFNADAAAVQLFFWCNWMHDKLYEYGFNEAAGNFQFENVFNGVDRGGEGGDPLLAEALRGALLSPPPVNNAVMLVESADGVSPTMRMFLWNGPEPDRDGDLDAEIILHEYTHGLSNRRVGGGVGLFTLQSVGLGEGWSDFMALALLSESQDGLGGNYAMGGYSTYQLGGMEENYYYGIRRYPYSTDLSKNPLTFKDIDPSQADPHAGTPHSPVIGGPAYEVHNQGEVWCAALWEVREGLIMAHDFPEGNARAIQLAVDGMNLAPPNPTFLQARDAILQADQIRYQGYDIDLIWAAFAKRGMGYSAATSPSWAASVAEAFDLPTPGGELWTYQTGNAVFSSPAVGPDGTIYFGSSDGKLYALKRDGTKKWEFAGGTNAFGGLYPFYSSPAVGPDGAIYIGSYDKKLYAVNPNGTLKWSYTAGNVIFPSPAIGADGAVYFGSQEGKVYALNSDGTLRWQFQAGSIGIGSSSAVDKDGVVYIGSYDNKLYAINPNGSQKWAITVGNWVASSPALDWTTGGVNPANGFVYFASYDGSVYSANTQDGTIRWQYSTGGIIVSSPVLDIEGNVYVGSEDGKLYSLTPNGTLRWSFQAGDVIYSSPAIGGDGRVYFGSYDRNLYVLKTDGTLLKSYLTGGEIYSSPVLAPDGRVYLGCLDSKLYSYPAEMLVAPSPWPMFRNDARRMGNHGFLWFDGGSFSPSGSFLTTVHSSITPLPYVVNLAQPNPLIIEWSNTLTNWNFPRSPLIDDPIGVYYRDDVVAIGHDRFFIRASVPTQPFIRSRNPYGFVKVSVPPGASLIANPLNTHDNTLNGLMPNVPDWTELYKFNEAQQNWDFYNYDPDYGGWPEVTLLPGEGAWINNPGTEPFVVTFIGEVLQGYLTRPLPAGLALTSSMVPQNGGLTTKFGYGADDGLATGDRVLQLVNPWIPYVTHVYNSSTGWSRTNPPPTFQIEPQPGYGEAFWINSGGTRNWKRTVSVWP